ncbi:SfnB family sulfur acquisition oxidoreductase [Methylobacillus gramineus]|uniref:SfnB family sulfur acquisition oxidoreductase n=1 Tax=Methylobacillus gramineus TaxID=755169 RepID=UPI001CFF6D14|nr:SfnB family sulfur acquisition oxidoreductase [Methylobacillus gramineus]MCB5184326.1 SfnB family sulfur acquisition oxidoreductase [Methylobacillus gramineus]
MTDTSVLLEDADTKEITRPQAHIIKSDAEAIEVAKRVAAEISKEAGIRDAERRLPRAELDLFSQSGLWGITVPKEYGGAFVSNTTLAEVIAIISEADPSIGQIPQNHLYMVEGIRLDGSEFQKQFFFALVLQGVRFGNAFSEIGTKSVSDVQTRIKPTEGGYLLSGKKFYSSGALLADWVPVVAKNEHDDTIVAFVKKGAKGLTIIDDWSSFGQRTTASGTTILEEIFVPTEYVLPHHLAFDRPTTMGPIAQIIQAGVDTGIARAGLRDTIQFVRNHTRPWIDTDLEHGYEDPLTIKDIGDTQIRVHATDALLKRAGEFIDIAQQNPNEETVAAASIAVAEAKVLSTETALHAGSKLFELAGTRSTLAQFNLDRHWRNARTHTLHDPVRWKYYAVGNYALNGVNPPRHPWI